MKKLLLLSIICVFLIQYSLQNCHDTCLTCSGPNNNECLTCPNRLPINGVCTCDTGKYVVAQGCSQCY